MTEPDFLYASGVVEGLKSNQKLSFIDISNAAISRVCAVRSESCAAAFRVCMLHLSLKSSEL